MPKNYLIGIGGTGARVIESVVHCCAAGFGPPALSIFLIDPDEGNGNLSRTKTLITRYQRCRASISDRATKDVRLFDTNISTPDPFVWSIFSDQNESLSRYVGYTLTQDNDLALAQFMEVLFSREELETPLNEGFRGHPSIGAVVMANASETSEPWQTFWNDVETSNGEHDVRVFLVGSIFGGTGAAGVPTFGAANMLKWHDKATLSPRTRVRSEESGKEALRPTGKSRIFLGATLVLPYFKVDLADKPAEAAAMFVTPADFPSATKAALQFYDEKDRDGELVFDQLYLIGDSLAQDVGSFSPGNAKQDNRPHYIELSTALAAFDFFRLDPMSDELRGGSRFFASCRDGVRVDWDALPIGRDVDQSESLRNEFKRRIASFAVFAYAFNTLGQDTLNQAHEKVDETWYRHHFKFSVRRSEDAEKDPRKDRGALNEIGVYAMDFLSWIAAMDDDEARVHLMDRARVFAPKQGDAASSLLHPGKFPAAIGGIVKGDPGQLLTFDAFLKQMNGLNIEGAPVTAVGRYIDLFYEASLGFVKANWRLAPPTS